MRKRTFRAPRVMPAATCRTRSREVAISPTRSVAARIFPARRRGVRPVQVVGQPGGLGPADAGRPFSKSVQCRFESDRGHKSRGHSSLGNSRFYAEVFERETTKEHIRLGTVRPVVDRPAAPWEMPRENRSCTSTQTVVVRPAADFAVTDIGIVRRSWRYRTLRSTRATQIQPQSATLVYSSSCVQCPASNLMGRVVGPLSA